MKQIKTIIFDLGGVLIDYDRDLCVEAFAKLGYDADKLVDPYKQSGVLLELEEGSAGPEALYAEVSRSVGHSVSPEAVDVALCSFLLDIPDFKLDMLLGLRKQGYQVFMLSNTNPIMFDYMERGVFRKQGLTVHDYFDRLFLSYKMGLVKPYPEIYRKMITESGIVPAETLFIDDSQANIETADGLGFNTYKAVAHEDYRPVFSQYEPF